MWTSATVFLGIYTYNNPDPKECWVVPGLDSGSSSEADAIARAEAMDIEMPEGFPMEMHAVFIFWFNWGFWAKIALLDSHIIGVVIYYGHNFTGKLLITLAYCTYAVNGIAWLITGHIWRYSEVARIASGDAFKTRPIGKSNEAWQE